jgi:hypothetical protein
MDVFLYMGCSVDSMGGCGSKCGAPTPMVPLDILVRTSGGYKDPGWGDLFFLNRGSGEG